MKLYEGMFLLDNQAVRTDWGRAKAAVVETLQKHGSRVIAARRWDERKLAYTIRGRRRATYLIGYFEATPEGVDAARRDLELDERVLRYLVIGADAVPEGEVEKSQAELAEGFTVPPPPQDDEPAPEPELAAAPDAGIEAVPPEASADADDVAAPAGAEVV